VLSTISIFGIASPIPRVNVLTLGEKPPSGRSMFF
jgi:hypothetical protein